MANELFKTAIEDAKAATDTTTDTTVKGKSNEDPDPYCCTPPDDGDPDQ